MTAGRPCLPAGIGRPTPEGAHRDGVDFVAVILVDRSGVKGGGSNVDLNRELEKMLLNQYEWPRYVIPAA